MVSIEIKNLSNMVELSHDELSGITGGYIPHKYEHSSSKVDDQQLLLEPLALHHNASEGVERVQ